MLHLPLHMGVAGRMGGLDALHSLVLWGTNRVIVGEIFFDHYIELLEQEVTRYAATGLKLPYEGDPSEIREYCYQGQERLCSYNEPGSSNPYHLLGQGQC